MLQACPRLPKYLTDPDLLTCPWTCLVVTDSSGLLVEPHCCHPYCSSCLVTAGLPPPVREVTVPACLVTLSSQPALPQSCPLLLLPDTSKARLARNLHPHFSEKLLGSWAWHSPPTIAHLCSRVPALDTLKSHASLLVKCKHLTLLLTEVSNI